MATGTEGKDFFEQYLEYVESNTVAPRLFHHWSAISGVAAALGKNFWKTRGHYRVYPNLYVMLIGGPGTGKGESTGILQTIIRGSGYNTFAADKSSKEKFLLDLQEGFSFGNSEQSGKAGQSGFSLASFLGDQQTNGGGEASEVFVLAEEFNDFIGLNNYEFIALLTKLWSFVGNYTNRLKNSKSVDIPEPCVNILGGNTSSGFAMAFPPEIIGQGFLSRLLPIYGEKTGKKIAFPEPPDPAVREHLSAMLGRIRTEINGEASIDAAAHFLLNRILQEWKPLADLRFQYYSERRFSQLLKLCLIYAAARLSTTISVRDIKAANTLLTFTENLMPKAIGEFGKAKNSDISSKIMEALYVASEPVDFRDLWKLVVGDLNSPTDLVMMLTGLSQAEKVQLVAGRDGKKGYLPKFKIKTENEELIDEDMQKKLH